MSARGWDVPMLSLPAVALAAGKLMKLPSDKLAQAVSLALNDHISMGQTRAQELSDWKGIADAEASRNAIFGAMLARAGLTGPAPIFEGRWGFFNLVTGPAEIDISRFGGHGVPFLIHQCGLKSYAAHITAQTTVPAAVALAKDIGNLDRIVAIEIGTTRRGKQIAGSDADKWAPETKETADHSLPYIAARAMIDGDIDSNSYTPDKLHDPRVLALMSKIAVREDPDFATLTVNVPPNSSHCHTRQRPKGCASGRQHARLSGAPGDRADVERKFRSNIGRRWPQQQTDAVLQSLWTFDQTHDLSALLNKMALPA